MAASGNCATSLVRRALGINGPAAGVRAVSGLLLAVWAMGPALAAERVFDFLAAPVGAPPPGWRSLVTGEGAPGDWQVIHVPGVAAGGDLEAVVAQLARDRTDEHFPLLVYEGERYGDFTLSVRLRTVAGEAEQMAGLAFRLYDPTNYYVLRVSSLGSTVRFYKVVDGVRSPPIGVNLEIPTGVWHELKVECNGSQIRCWLGEKELFPPLTDNSFTLGRIALWTKSDSVSQFADLKVVYRPWVILAQRLVAGGMEKYGRLLGLQIYAAEPGSDEIRLVATSGEQPLGQLGGKVEEAVIRDAAAYYGNEQGEVSVVLPLRDRNGDPVAAVRVIMKSFPGQTEKNALARAQPIVRELARQVRERKDLFD